MPLRMAALLIPRQFFGDREDRSVEMGCVFVGEPCLEFDDLSVPDAGDHQDAHGPDIENRAALETLRRYMGGKPVPWHEAAKHAPWCKPEPATSCRHWFSSGSEPGVGVQ